MSNENFWPLFLPSSSEMREYDKNIISKGIAGIELVERAGSAVFQKILLHENPNKITVLCGGGNNGADGVVLARLFRDYGKSTSLILADCPRYTDELIACINKYIDAGGKVSILPSDQFVPPSFDYSILAVSEFSRLIQTADLIIDALLGTGQKSEPKGGIADIVKLVNEVISTDSRLISVDSPTGINCDTGEVYPLHFSPSKNICIEFLKRGLLQSPARDNIRDIDNVTIGIEAIYDPEFLILDQRCKKILQPRRRSDHKGTLGKLLVIGGSFQMPGAPILVANSALRAGTGSVIQTFLSSPVPVAGIPEIMYLPINKGILTLECLGQIRDKFENISALVVGPGIGTDNETLTFLANLFEIITENKLPTVIDADALNLLAKLRGQNLLALPNAVITPHPKEAGRLLGTSTAEVQADRYSSVKQLHDITQSIVVLKGPASIIWNGKSGCVNVSGTPYLATAGSGDVLSGMIGAFLAQGYSMYNAAKLGVYLHGKAGEIAHLRKKGPIIASDIIDSIPSVIGI